jgi:phosphatidylglycerophosphate synthase
MMIRPAPDFLADTAASKAALPPPITITSHSSRLDNASLPLRFFMSRQLGPMHTNTNSVLIYGPIPRHLIIIREYGVSKLRVEFLVSLGVTALLGATFGTVAFMHRWGSPAYTVAYLSPFLATGLIGWARIEPDHAHRRLGPANWITIGRLGIACLLFGLAADLAATGAVLPATAAWTVIALALAGFVLDGVDGWIARRTGYESAFGARFDMEVDAFLILVLSVIAWQLDKAGPWVILLGAMRYLFWMTGLVFSRFAAPLPASFRRKAACIIAGVAVTVSMAPVVVPPASTWLAAVALAVLGYSFLVDSLWLVRRTQPVASRRR